ncbi:sigma-70 family RNA polymerase sigma factor [Fodinicola acaciae]|uniref:sigma-70 family RNA polymerase sigma factor n=1 Tax=Fodinicola acaciae TaxID=2681555 RepID=UPI001C9E7D7C|nr:sigma-70 family RNA polymerase sigma factor [Fodinicola acaciae]
MATATEREQLDTIFRATHGRLVVAMYALTGDLGEAQDVVAETFVRAVAHRRVLLEAEKPEAWLRTVARNIARRRWRRATQLTSLLRRSADPPPVSSDSALNRVALLAVLRKLPAPQREAIALHYIADLSVADIAVTQGVTVNAVKSRLARGRARLAELLGEDSAEDLDIAITSRSESA